MDFLNLLFLYYKSITFRNWTVKIKYIFFLHSRNISQNLFATKQRLLLDHTLLAISIYSSLVLVITSNLKNLLQFAWQTILRKINMNFTDIGTYTRTNPHHSFRFRGVNGRIMHINCPLKSKIAGQPTIHCWNSSLFCSNSNRRKQNGWRSVWFDYLADTVRLWL